MNIENYWDAVLRQKEDEIREYFDVDAIIRWHNTNEQFTLEDFIVANCEYPGSWYGEIERIEKVNDLIITVTHVYTIDTSMSFHVTSFFRIIDDKIISIDEYWGDDGIAPQWRLDKKIGTKIK